MTRKGFKLFRYVFLLSFISGLFFLSPNLTGNVIGEMDKLGSTLLGIVLIVIGILGYYFISKFASNYL